MNCILYILDSLRPDHLSCYGYERETDPNMKKLAEDGVICTNTFSQATFTAPSAGSIITGTYPTVHKGTLFSKKLDKNAPRLPVCLKENGLATAAFSSIGIVSRRGAYDKGFDHFHEDYEPNAQDIPARLNDEIFSWLQNNHKKDFFLFVWSLGTHVPYFFPGKGRFTKKSYGRSIDASVKSLKRAGYEDKELIRDLYDSAIYYNDYCIGELLRKIHKSGLYDETLFIVTADHGDIFDEHGRLDHAYRLIKALSKISFMDPLWKRARYFKKKHGFLGHGSVLPYDELLHVPLIIKFPNNAFGGRILDALLQSIDIMPTILDYLEIDIPENVQGKSMLSVLNAQKTEINWFAYSESKTMKGSNIYYSILDADHKFISVIYDPCFNLRDYRMQRFRYWHSLVEYLLAPRNVLFDRSKEGKDISHENPEIVQKLEMELHQWKEQNRLLSDKLGKEAEEIELDQEVWERLKALGYID